MSTFARLAAPLREAIVARLGWTALRPVQELAAEQLLDGRNAIVLAPTAGGKTEAAVFPILSRLLEQPTERVGVLYIAPIKALLNNQAERLGLYTEMVGLRRFVWHGDADRAEKDAFVLEPAELLMTTPESLEVMLISSKVSAQKLFEDLRAVIIDEVHALAGTDRGAHLASVLERITRLSAHDVQRVGLSATVGNPEAILKWLAGSSSWPGVIVDPPKELVRRELLVIYHEELGDLARDSARSAKGQKSLFFCQSRALTEVVAARMRSAGTTVFVHHSSVSAEERAAAEARFYHGTDACIVCTSTLELGVDVGDLDRVFQADAPSTVSSFLQRMGRTGRRPGQSSNTTFLCQSVETVLQSIALIELARSNWVEPVRVQTRCWPVLVHQLLAMALASGGVRPADAWETLSRVPDFSGIRAEEFDAMARHMVENDDLFLAGGRLVMGERAERVYGRKNFMELYAVFSTPQLYTVATKSGRELGSLEQNFVDQLEEDRSSFLLAGRPWTVQHINHQERRVIVESAHGGKKPSWGGFAPQLLSFELCQRIRQVLVEDRDYRYLHTSAAQILATHRAQFSELLRDSGAAILMESDEAVWWTFAGGRINAALRYALELLGPWKASSDNFAVRLRGDSVLKGDVDSALRTLAEPGLWQDEPTWAAIRSRLPAYRLSKFQGSLPSWAQEEMLEAFLLDRVGAKLFGGTQTNAQWGIK